MSNSVCEVLITQSPLALPARGIDAASGAMVDFWGIVRALEDGKEITGIEYEAHREMAEHQMRGIAERATIEFGLAKVVIHHRIGFVPAGEASVAVRVQSAHRAAAFGANQWIMDELKQTVPIWKNPIYREMDVSSPAKRPQDSLGSLSAHA